MATTAELIAIKEANPSLSIPGLDTSVGLQVPKSSLESFRTLGSTDGVYYNSTLNVVVVWKSGVDLTGIDFSGTSVMVQANNVTISNCAFDASSGLFSLKFYPGYSNLTVDHCSFDGLKLNRGFNDFIASNGQNATITNSTFLNAPNDAIYIENGTVSHNYIEGGGYQTGAHADAIWVGKTTGSVTISDNVVDWRWPPDAPAEPNNAIRITGENGNVNDVTVTGNVLLGGTTTVCVTYSPYSVTNVQVIGNVVDYGHWGHLYQQQHPTDLVYEDNVLVSGPAPAIGEGTNLQPPALNHITGSALADTFNGSSQADYIRGGDGKDWISAGAGNDVILGGSARDYLTGGAGADHFMYTSVAEAGIGFNRDLIADFQVGIDKIYLAGLQDLPPAAVDGAWHLVGWKYFTGAPLEIRSYVEGANTVLAFDIDGDMKTDMEIELAGMHTVTADYFLITTTTPSFNPGSSFVVTNPATTIAGTAAADRLTGTATAERLVGEAGNDIINGEGGDDVIVGGAGKDIMTGGTGRDRFVFETASDSLRGTYRDFIQDFTPGQDVIDISAIDAKTDAAGHDAFTWIGYNNFVGVSGQLRYQYVGTNTIIFGDTNGDKVPDFEIGLVGNLELRSSDFLFVLTGAPVITSNGGTDTASIDLDENTRAVASVTAFDPDAGATLIYSIVGGADAAKFTIDAGTGELTFLSAPDYERASDRDADNVYEVAIRVSDGTNTDTQALAVRISNVNDNVPVITSDGGTETAAVGAAENTKAVTSVSAIDLDAGATLSYSIVGGADADKFTMDVATGELSFLSSPDRENPIDVGGDNVYDVVVQVSDGTNIDTQSIAVRVSDVNDNAPVIISNGGAGTASVAVAENTGAVTRVTAVDLDAGATLAYSIVGGADADRFTIDAATGELAFLSAPDYEIPTDVGTDNVYDVAVQVSDGTATDIQSIAVSISNLDESDPQFPVGRLPDLVALNNITGSSVVDVLKGSSRADYIVGGQANDWIAGGTGDDVIRGGVGRDYLTGGAGADIFTYANVNEFGDLIYDFEIGRDKIYLADLQGLAAVAQDASWSWLGQGSFSGNALELRVYYNASYTFLAADLDGDRQADVQIQFAGQLNLGSSDIIVDAAPPDPHLASASPNVAPADVISGTAGADTLNGGSIAEEIIGGGGNDVIRGGAGDDVIIGGTGLDKLTGGEGHDQFVFESKIDSVPGAGRDVISDFTQGEDVIDVSQFDADPATAALDAFSWIGASGFSGAAGQLRSSVYSHGTVVQADLNGDKAADFEIWLTSTVELTSHDFLLA